MFTWIRPILTLTLCFVGVLVSGASTSTVQANQQTAAQPASLAAIPALAGLAAAGGDPAVFGRQVFEQADLIESGYVDLQVQLSMVLRDARGRESQRGLRIRQLEVPEDADKVLVVFDTPANIRGTALLSHAHVNADDDQWLFLPAIKRTKKIASRNKSGPFLGSEFSFEDLSPRDVAKYDYAYIREEQIEGQPCWVVDRFPRDKYSGYSRQRVWLDQAHLRIQRIDYVNRRDEVIKRLQVDEYQLYADRYWKPGFMRMENLRNGKSTDLIWRDYAFMQGFEAERDFSVASLRRAR